MQDDPDNEEYHMLLSRGKRWKRLRAINALASTVSSLKELVPILHEASDRFIEIVVQNTDKAWDIYP